MSGLDELYDKYVAHDKDTFEYQSEFKATIKALFLETVGNYDGSDLVLRDYTSHLRKKINAL